MLTQIVTLGGLYGLPLLRLQPESSDTLDEIADLIGANRAVLSHVVQLDGPVSWDTRVLDQLVLRLLRDPRTHDLMVLYEAPVTARDWPALESPNLTTRLDASELLLDAPDYAELAQRIQERVGWLPATDELVVRLSSPQGLTPRHLDLLAVELASDQCYLVVPAGQQAEFLKVLGRCTTNWRLQYA